MHKRNLLLALAVAYLGFVIYGSLVPLEYRPIPLAQAWQNFANIRYLALGIGSRADWVANILLFIPLSFLWLGLLWRGETVGGKLLATAAVFGAGLIFSLALEFSQLFFPPRTVSQNDILAAAIGNLIGILLWWWKGPPTAHWIGQLIDRHDNSAERLLWLYLALLFGYNVLPLDLTISPVELYHKWTEGKIILTPLAGYAGNAAEIAYGLFADIVLWIPAAFLWRVSGRKNAFQAWLWTVIAATLLETAQLLVFSRVTDISDILAAALGGAIGCLLAKFFIRSTDTAEAPNANRKLSAGLIASLFMSLLVLAVFWYPFDFRFEREFLRPRFDGFYQVPFINYYYGTEFRAVTEVIHKIFFFLPLGIALAYAKQAIRLQVVRDYFKLFALLYIVALAFGVELGQTALPGKFPDNTDLALEIFGGFLGFFAYRHFSNRGRPRFRPAATNIELLITILPAVLTTIFVVFVGALLVAALPGIPYNVRELFGGASLLYTTLLLSAGLLAGFGLPVWLSARLAHDLKQMVFKLPLALLLQTALTWFLIRAAVPLESIHDIVGSPVLGWPWEWELMLRFIALFIVPSALLALSALIVLSLPLRLNALHSYYKILFWLPGGLLLLLLGHIVVVKSAATDNLTELMAGNGNLLSSLMLALWCLCLTGCATLLAQRQAADTLVSRGFSTLATLLLSAPVAYLFFMLGTQDQVQKYGQTFSALQFLVSQDRAHLVSGSELYARFAVAHYAAVTLLFLAQLPAWHAYLSRRPRTSAVNAARRMA